MTDFWHSSARALVPADSQRFAMMAINEAPLCCRHKRLQVLQSWRLKLVRRQSQVSDILCVFFQQAITQSALSFQSAMSFRTTLVVRNLLVRHPHSVILSGVAASQMRSSRRVEGPLACLQRQLASPGIFFSTWSSCREPSLIAQLCTENRAIPRQASHLLLFWLLTRVATLSWVEQCPRLCLRSPLRSSRRPFPHPPEARVVEESEQSWPFPGWHWRPAQSSQECTSDHSARFGSLVMPLRLSVENLVLINDPFDCRAIA